MGQCGKLRFARGGLMVLSHKEIERIEKMHCYYNEYALKIAVFNLLETIKDLQSRLESLESESIGGKA